ncbi:MAG: DUF1592 domain-containing protein [Myxococcales bacterium]|nr:DUF1592 domain-containing protein [Myxococcales bacterium]
MRATKLLWLLLPWAVSCVGDLEDGEKPPVDATGGGGGGTTNPECQDMRTYFALQVWPTLAQQCSSCHAPGGEASTGDNAKQKTAGFVLQWDTHPGFLDENIAQLDRMVLEEVGDIPKLLLKPTGGDTHVGGALFASDSPEYKALEQFAAMTKDPTLQCATPTGEDLSTVGVHGWDETYRRAALVLGGRLPTADEIGIADEVTFDARLTALLAEEGFIRRIKTFFNDTLLTEAGASVQVSCFQFPTDNYPASQECKDGATAFCTGLTGAELTACTSAFNAKWTAARRALTDEPLEIIANVVRKNRPFTEILTADYTMVNPYSAILYGLEADFDAPSPENYGDWKEEQVTALVDGAYPHVGVLSTPGFLGRWVSTATNRDRGRARIVYDAFLATNVLALAQRPVDTSALTAVANAPRNASACSACHTTVDPVANSFSAFPDSASIDFDPNMTAATNRHQEMLPPGFGAEAMPGQEKDMLGWMATRITEDPRFSLSMTRILYRGITGRTPQPYPTDLAAADLEARFHAWDTEDRFLQDVAKAFREGGYDVRIVVSRIVKSPFFRASTVPDGFNAHLASRLGGGRLLTPELAADKVQAVFGTHWGSWDATGNARHLLLTDYEVFYGGIDSLAVTERLADPNSLFSSVAARMANEMACRSVAWDFTKPPAERLLFPAVETSSVPATDEAEIRENIAYLIARLTGVQEPVDGAEVTAAYQVFADTYAQLAAAADPALPSSCQGRWDRATPQGQNCSPTCTSYVDTPLDAADQITDDPDYTIRSWMAVVSYLLNDYRFLFQ